MRTSRYSRFKNLVRPHLLSISVAGLFLILSIVLLLSRFNDTHIGTTIKLFSSNIIYSISSTVSSPVRLINEGINNIKSLGTLYEDLKRYNLLIGEASAEMIKKEVGIALPPKTGDGKTIDIKGRDLASGVPKEIELTQSQVAEALSEPIQSIIEGVKSALEDTPPELSADLVDMGVVLTGGGALLESMDEAIREATGLPVTIADEALSCVALGSGKALESESSFEPILSSAY